LNSGKTKVSPAVNFQQEADQITPQLVEWRRDFHRHPELGYEEHRSAKIVAKHLKEWGYEVQEGIAETGVLARLKGNGTAPGVLLRVDMDALPIQEESEKDYASIYPGAMHACGHDGHMAIGLGVAYVISKWAQQISGDVYFVFQPAEEGGGGAARMIAEGVLENINASVAYGVHLWNEKPLGWFGITPGPIMAGAERFEMSVRGKGGHGGMPHLTQDPIVASAAIVSGVQAIIARNIDSLQSGVISFTSIRGGNNFNVIPDEVMLEGTIRTLEPAARLKLIQRFREVAEQIGHAYQCELNLSVEQVAPVVVNDPEITDHIRRIAVQQFPDMEIAADYRVMVSEDMAYFLEQMSGVFIFVGSSNEAQGLSSSHHTASFDFDERALSSAVTLLAAAIWEKVKTND
jgi:amidohydrolase